MSGLPAAALVGALVALLVGALTRRQNVAADEAWILVVAERLAHRHDVLYRDVFFGVAPLPMWLLLTATRRAGVEVAVLRAWNAVASGVLAGATWHLVAGTLGQPWWAALTAVMLVAPAGGPVADQMSWYENISRAGVMFALVAAADGSPQALVLAGAGVGVAGMAKYTVGAVTAPTVLALAWCTATQRVWLLGGVGAALAVAVATLAPLARHPGALRSMAFRLGPGKRSFVEHGRISLWHLVRAGSQPVRLPALAVPLALVALVAVVAAAAAGVPSALLWGAITALLAFWSCTWPRADSTHLRGGLPFAAVAALMATLAWRHGGGPDLLSPIRLALVPWAFALSAIGLRSSVARGAFRRPDRVVRGCRGAGCRFSPEEVRALWVASELAGGAAMVLGDDAPLVYLVSGIHDPTPYDYPLASVFGPHGQADVAGRIRSGQITHVVEVDAMPTSMAPVEIDAAVRECTEVVWQEGPVRLRRVRAQR